MLRPRIFKLESPDTPGVVRFLSGLHVTLEEGAKQSWVTVTRTGKFHDPRYGQFEITRPMLLSMVANFDKGTYGQEIFFDKAHNPSDGAAAKVLKLSVEGDRLRALVEWTPFGIDLVKNKGYRYLSAEYIEDWVDNEGGAHHGPLLMGAGLTIRPVIKRLDPIQLSEAGGEVPVLLHPILLSELLSEVKDTMNEHLKKLRAALESMKLSEAAINSIIAAAEKAMGGMTDEAQMKACCEGFGTAAKQLAEQIGDKPVTLKVEFPAISKTLSEEDVRKMFQAESKRLAAEAKDLSDKRDANVKLLSETINAATGIDEATRKELADSVADLVTPEMTADQVKKLAESQITMGNKLAAAKKLAGMGFEFRGSAHISVDSSNEVKALQEEADKRLGIAGMAEAKRFEKTGGSLQPQNKELAEKVLAAFDAQRAPQLHREHKMLAAGDGLVSDVAVPGIFERTVLRESLYQLVGLQFVDSGTTAFSSTADIPYSYRDTTAAGRSAARVYEGGAIARAGIKQALETAYPIPQKLAFEVSDEMRYLCSNGQFINWDIVAENARNAIRIIGEDTEHLIFNEILNAADQYSVTAVANEATASGDGSKSIFVLDNFPVVRPKVIKNLQGSQVGSTLYPVAIKVNNVAITEWDGTGTQAAGLYYWMDYNLGELHFVDDAGAASAVTNTHAIVSSYSYTTNVYKFDTDLGSLAVDAKYDDFLYRFGLRKSIIEDQRYHMCNFGLMSGTVKTQIEQAKQFSANYARPGTNLTAEGNLGVIKGVPTFKAFAPGLNMGDVRVIIGERNQTRYRMAKPWQMGELQDQKDSNGRYTGKKEAYGDQFVFLHTPTQLKAAYTSVVLYSATARVDR